MEFVNMSVASTICEAVQRARLRETGICLHWLLQGKPYMTRRKTMPRVRQELRWPRDARLIREGGGWSAEENTTRRVT